MKINDFEKLQIHLKLILLKSELAVKRYEKEAHNTGWYKNIKSKKDKLTSL